MWRALPNATIAELPCGTLSPTLAPAAVGGYSTRVSESSDRDCLDLSVAVMPEGALQGAIHGQWLINVGSQTAIERLAHLLCGLLVRLHAVSLANQDGCTLWACRLSELGAA
jgi:hypothetical protein